jgi:threonylcarbamoyladenosine tRNA methylthiotransferase MtaB
MPQVDPATIKARAAQLRAEVAALRGDWLASLLGRPMSVLAERDGTGHAPDFARALVPPGTKAGTLVTITPTQIAEGLLQ